MLSACKALLFLRFYFFIWFFLMFNAFVFVLVFGIVCLLLTFLYFKKRHLATTPSIMASIGVIGTFTGITLGLLQFDVNDIDGSIAQLLEGLKLSFFTSLTGLVLATLVKYQQSQRASQPKLISPDAFSPENWFQLHQSQVQMQEKQFEEQTKAYAKLGEDFNNVIETLTKSATSEIVDALREVISDFNNQLTEQFGENFKELNQAVHALVTWQDNYKTQLETMINQFDASVKAMQANEQAISSVSEQVSKIPEAMDQLQDSLESIKLAFDCLITLKNKAEQTFPDMSRQLEDVIEKAGRAPLAIRESITDQLKQSNDVINKQMESLDEAMQQELTRQLTAMGQGLTSITKRFSEDFRNLMQHMSKLERMMAERG
jgi:exonuclease VII small subunit